MKNIEVSKITGHFDSLQKKIQEMTKHRQDMGSASLQLLSGEISKEKYDKIAKISRDELSSLAKENF